jgi:hypothetical protein
LGEAERLSSRAEAPGTMLFRVSAAFAIALHVFLIFGRDGVWGGGDLIPHLHVLHAMREKLALYNTYAPGYSMLGALASPIVGAELYVKYFALAAFLSLIAGFRFFQRAAHLPEAASAVFVFTPYWLALSSCTPKVEALGYALLLVCLGLLLKNRYVGAGLVLAACFYWHTASALLLGLVGGILCVARRDMRGIAALAFGSALAIPLVATHLAAGCSLAESLMLARGGFSPVVGTPVVPPNWPWLVPLANPAVLVAASLGAASTWRWNRPIAILCCAFVLLYFNNVWLAPFEIRTLVTLLRGLPMLAIAIAIAAGVFASRSTRTALWVVGLAAAGAVVSLPSAIPNACFTKRIDLAQASSTSIDRCIFRWQLPAGGQSQPPGAGPPHERPLDP